MSITVVPGQQTSHAPLTPASWEQVAAAFSREPRPSDHHARGAVETLHHFAAERGLEVRLHLVPESGTTIIRFVDRRTREVVREFPSEDLSRVLAAIRNRSRTGIDARA